MLGPAYRLFYRTPVHLVKGEGAHVWDADGTEYLDVYNNVASVGHAHPRVVEAIARQASLLNTHTRYLHENILNYADDILSTMPDELNRIMFQCTGSEANDLAVRVAQAYTGGEGVIVTAEAYHGNSALTSKLSPALGTAQDRGLTMRMIPTPDTYRLSIDGKPASACTAEEFGGWMAAEVRKAVADMNRHGIRFAALLADSIFSSDGVYPDPVGYLQPRGSLAPATRSGDSNGRGSCPTWSRAASRWPTACPRRSWPRGRTCSSHSPDPSRTSTPSAATPCAWPPRRPRTT